MLVHLILFGLAAQAHAVISNHNRAERSAISYVWENATIPYFFVPEYEQRDRDMFLQATKFIQDRTCVRFREKQQGDRCSLRMVYGGCCGTHGGRQPWCDNGGSQDATFSKGLPRPFYLHELGHTLGFPHEQDREDRDNYIYWDKDKTTPQCTDSGFANKATNLDQAALDIFFDYVSLMADWTECYWPKTEDWDVPKDIPLGPGASDDRAFSVLDIEKINAIYDCRGCNGYRFRQIKQLAAYQRPILGGYELDGKPFYICRIYMEGHLLIGKSQPDEDRCWTAWDGNEKQFKKKFEVLTNPYGGNFRWVERPDNFAVPRGAIKGGRTKDRETIYIGRCSLEQDGRKTLIPGFVLESNTKELRVPYGGGARRCTDFEYLVCN